MRGLFNLDSPIMVFLSRIADLMVLNIITVICCIPIVTIGPALTALYYQTIRMARGEDTYIFKGYFKSFKENFKQGMIIGLIVIAAVVVVVCDYWIMFNGMTGKVKDVLMVVITIIAIFLVCTVLYVFPVLARYENNVKNTFRNAFLISIMNLPKTVVMLIITLLPVLLCLINTQLMIIPILFGISGVAYLNSLLLVGSFRKIEGEEKPDKNAPEEELQPLSFIVEEQEEKKRELERKAAEELESQSVSETAENEAEN